MNFKCLLKFVNIRRRYIYAERFCKGRGWIYVSTIFNWNINRYVLEYIIGRIRNGVKPSLVEFKQIRVDASRRQVDINGKGSSTGRSNGWSLVVWRPKKKPFNSKGRSCGATIPYRGSKKTFHFIFKNNLPIKNILTSPPLSPLEDP